MGNMVKKRAEYLTRKHKKESDIRLDYNDGPWASTGSDWRTDVAGYWHFPGPDVSGKDEADYPIIIERLDQGFLIEYAHDLEVSLAFTDRVDATEWLLGWLGFEDGIVESVREILAGLWDADELTNREEASWQVVVEAARAYTEDDSSEAGYDRLARALKNWQMAVNTQ